MRRREFVTLLIGGAGASLRTAAWAQSPQRARRVGVLFPFGENDPEVNNRIKQFRLGLRDLNWIEGRDILIDFRFAGSDLESITRHVAELIKAAPEVIVSYATPGLAAVRRATSTIPIVFVNVTDPLGQGVVPSLAHPGGNITGFSFIEPEIVGKWINLLGDVRPGLSRVALMFNPDTAPFFDSYYRSFRGSPQQSAVEVEVAHVRTAAEIESVITKLGSEAGSGLMLGSDAFIVNMREPIIKLANERGLPTISPYRQFVAEGSLAAYGPDTGDISRRASAYVDRILKGEQAGNLPVQSPIRFELAVNLKTARALGLSPRELFLELCDEVIE
jgi:putative ABC transport system substrate-binding protein